MLLTATPGRNATDQFGAVSKGLLGMECTLLPGKTLANHFRVFIDQNAHISFPEYVWACHSAAINMDRGPEAAPTVLSNRRHDFLGRISQVVSRRDGEAAAGQ